MAQPTAQSITAKTLLELRRCMEALQEYQLSRASEIAWRDGEPRKLAMPWSPAGVTHAAAHRATLDAWRMLARWRRESGREHP